MDIIALVLSLIALIVALADGGCIVKLHKGSNEVKGLYGVLAGIRDVLKGAAGDEDVDAWLFAKLAEYAERAVHAIQQRYHNGDIEADERKDAALDLVRDFALIDGVMIDDKLLVIASELIEAECDAMGHAAPEADKETQD